MNLYHFGNQDCGSARIHVFKRGKTEAVDLLWKQALEN